MNADMIRTGTLFRCVYDRIKGFSIDERDIIARRGAMRKKFLADRRGASAIEYSILAMFLSLAIIAGARSIASNLSTTMYGPIANNLN